MLLTLTWERFGSVGVILWRPLQSHRHTFLLGNRVWVLWDRLSNLWYWGHKGCWKAPCWHCSGGWSPVFCVTWMAAGIRAAASAAEWGWAVGRRQLAGRKSGSIGPKQLDNGRPGVGEQWCLLCAPPPWHGPTVHQAPWGTGVDLMGAFGLAPCWSPCSSSAATLTLVFWAQSLFWDPGVDFIPTASLGWYGGMSANSAALEAAALKVLPMIMSTSRSCSWIRCTWKSSAQALCLSG